jgi:hypothetical protein
LEKRSKDDANTLHVIRTYGKWLLKLGLWQEGEELLLRAIAGYESKGDHYLDHGYAHKDLADGLLMRSGSDPGWRNLDHFEDAKEHYLEAKQLFMAVHSDFADTFINNVSSKLASIEFQQAKLTEERRARNRVEGARTKGRDRDRSRSRTSSSSTQIRLNQRDTRDIKTKHDSQDNVNPGIMSWLFGSTRHTLEHLQ